MVQVWWGKGTHNTWLALLKHNGLVWVPDFVPSKTDAKFIDISPKHARFCCKKKILENVTTSCYKKQTENGFVVRKSSRWDVPTCVSGKMFCLKIETFVAYICHLNFIPWSVYIQMMCRHTTLSMVCRNVQYNANNLFCWLGCCLHVYISVFFFFFFPFEVRSLGKRCMGLLFFFFTSPDVCQLGSGSICVRSYDMAYRSQTSSALVMTTLDFLCVRE